MALFDSPTYMVGRFCVLSADKKKKSATLKVQILRVRTEDGWKKVKAGPVLTSVMRFRGDSAPDAATRKEWRKAYLRKWDALASHFTSLEKGEEAEIEVMASINGKFLNIRFVEPKEDFELEN
ncbi:hypothetical protein D6779_09650 [Candidatus Parcubacteria bacterium]|nr:MAG: hypothetical protein D6779_09650 [Candidatus Parcubacteria bacterium]